MCHVILGYLCVLCLFVFGCISWLHAHGRGQWANLLAVRDACLLRPVERCVSANLVVWTLLCFVLYFDQ